MINRITVLAFIFFCLGINAQSNWYVNQSIGLNTNTGTSISSPFQTVEHCVNNVSPGDTILIVGEYANSQFDASYTYSNNILDPHIWHAENTIKINNLNGANGQYITIKPYDNSTLLRGDGANIFRVQNSSYLRIEGFEIEGMVDSIPLSTGFDLQFLYVDPVALDPTQPQSGEVLYRVPLGTTDAVVATMTFPILGSVARPTYTDTRGLYLSQVHHIEIVNNNIHHMPGGGLRVADCEYVEIRGNEVHYNSLRSYSGTHGLVVTKAKSSNTLDDYKIKIIGNKVHHNYNEVYSWAPTKNIITPHLDEGKGISLQRNNDPLWTHGRFLVANNLCYWNGFSGVHTNDGWRMDFINNTCYFNSYTKTVTNAGTNSTGGNIGISAQGSDDIIIKNNISIIDPSLEKFAISADPNTTNLQVSDNLVYAGGSLVQDPEILAVQTSVIVSDPSFVDPASFDFSLQVNSPARNVGNISVAPTNDYFGNMRDAQPDLGAIEYISGLGLLDKKIDDVNVYPNPFSNHLFIDGDFETNDIYLFDIGGREVDIDQIHFSNSTIQIKTADLKPGSYLLKCSGLTKRIVKL